MCIFFQLAQGSSWALFSIKTLTTPGMEHYLPHIKNYFRRTRSPPRCLQSLKTLKCILLLLNLLGEIVLRLIENLAFRNQLLARIWSVHYRTGSLLHAGDLIKLFASWNPPWRFPCSNPTPIIYLTSTSTKRKLCHWFCLEENLAYSQYTLAILYVKILTPGPWHR